MESQDQKVSEWADFEAKCKGDGSEYVSVRVLSAEDVPLYYLETGIDLRHDTVRMKEDDFFYVILVRRIQPGRYYWCCWPVTREILEDPTMPDLLRARGKYAYQQESMRTQEHGTIPGRSESGNLRFLGESGEDGTPETPRPSKYPA